MYDPSTPWPITLGNVRSLVAFFSKYDVPTGIRACDAFLSANAVLNKVNLPDWIVLADQHKLKRFLEKCVPYAAEHISKIAKPEKWVEQLSKATLLALVCLATINDANYYEIMLPIVSALQMEALLQLHKAELLCCRSNKVQAMLLDTKSFCRAK